MKDVLFGDTITIWNHYIDPATRDDAWQRTVLRGVQYRKTTQKAVGSGGTTGAVGIISVGDSASVTIPVNVDAGGRHYLVPEAFKASANRANYWTLDAASNKDVIVLGEIAQEVGAAYTLTQLKAAHLSRYGTVKSVSDNTLRPRLKHYKVVAV